MSTKAEGKDPQKFTSHFARDVAVKLPDRILCRAVVENTKILLGCSSTLLSTLCNKELSQLIRTFTGLFPSSFLQLCCYYRDNHFEEATAYCCNICISAIYAVLANFCKVTFIFRITYLRIGVVAVVGIHGDRSTGSKTMLYYSEQFFLISPLFDDFFLILIYRYSN